MGELQGLARFPGIAQVLRAEFPLSHGITPSVAVLEIVPQEGLLAEAGPLELTFGPTRLVFPDCHLDRASIRRAADGSRLSVQVLDRRWRWRFGSIDGHYNVRRNWGHLEAPSVRTPQQLATLLLEAMGESGFDVSALPNGSRPTVLWVGANPAAELAELCDALGCRVVLGLDNRVVLRRVGAGQALPLLGLEMTAGYGVTAAIRPDALRLVAGPTIFQRTLPLEAVGLDRNGDIVPIDELSYRPDGGWGLEWVHGFSNVDVHARPLARETVFRWYRIVMNIRLQDGQVVPAGEGDPDELRQILPLERELVEEIAGANGLLHSRAPYVAGVFWPAGLDFRNTADRAPLNEPFTLNLQRGTVEFDQPVVRLAGLEHAAAELELTCAFRYRDPRTRLPVRFTRTRLLGNGPGDFPHVLHADDLNLTDRERRNEDGNPAKPPNVTNLEELKREADARLDAAAAQFVPHQTSDCLYAGLLPIEPDGAIQQVTWTAGSEGATTRASRNNEHHPSVPAYQTRRRTERARRRERT